MNRNRLLLAAGGLVLIGLIGLIVWVVVMRLKGGVEDQADVSPTALITTAQVRSQTVQETTVVYGMVQADPADNITVAAPRAVIVKRMLVRAGQTVRAGEPLVEVSSAPGSELAYRQAEDAVTFAQTDLARLQRLFDERLAGADQVSAAKKTLADAQATLKSQRSQGGDHAVQTIAAPQAGVVTTVSAAAGDHIAQDAALMVMARGSGTVAKLGLEPPIDRFRRGQAVLITPVSGGAAMHSTLSMVGQSADQTTKTIDTIAPLNGAALPIGSAVEGDIITGSHTGLLAPRAAVVFDETGPHVFVVQDGKAKRVFVSVGADQGEEIEVKGLPSGSSVAVEGAYELQDGMSVKVRAQ